MFGLAGVLAVGSAAAGCPAQGIDRKPPVSALGVEVTVEREFRALVRDWLAAPPDARAEVDERIATFCKNQLSGEVRRYALVLHAWNALESGEHERAAALAGEVEAGEPGVARDLATLVHGAAERRMGHHQAALDRLERLLHKLLDDWAIALLDEELCEAAIGAGKPKDAVHFMEVWLRETDPGARPRVAERIRALLERLPLDVLRGTAEGLDPDARSDDHPSFAELLVIELARIAGQLRDVDLARMLLDRFGGLLGSEGEAVARLAAETNRARVAKDTVGLLLSLRNEEMARRSAEVSGGVAFGLGLPRAEAHLVSRAAQKGGHENKGEIDAALAALASGGASIIIAGVDPDELVHVAAFARREALPVVFLQPPPAGLESEFAFSIGEDAATDDGLLAAALAARGAHRLARFGRLEEHRAEVQPFDVAFTVLERACDRSASSGDLRAAGVDGVLVVDGAACGAELADAATAAGLPLAVGLGVARLGSVGTMTLAAGLFPVGVEGPPELQGWLQARSLPPSFWSALGRDAAALAWRAVRGLEDAASDDPSKVAAVRRRARDALGSAFEALWTSDARSFDATRRLPRDKRMVARGERRRP